MRHPAELFLKTVLIEEPTINDGGLMMALQENGFLAPDPMFLPFLRASMNQDPPPEDFNAYDKLNRQSVKWLRRQGVYDWFHTSPAVMEAKLVLRHIPMRLAVEQIILARLDYVYACKRVNQKHGWKLMADTVEAYRHYFWNVDLLTFDEWGRFLYNRSAWYERYMSLLQGPSDLAYFHLKIDQIIESKRMIQRTQQIAYFTLEEAAQKPGVNIEKVKAIGVLGKTIIDSHNALSTSDMQIKDVLQQFERFQMKHPELPAPDIRSLAPAGNFTNSGTSKSDADDKVVVETTATPEP